MHSEWHKSILIPRERKSIMEERIKATKDESQSAKVLTDYEYV